MTVDEQRGMIKSLREQTGECMMECKKALTRTNWDKEKALQWLKNSGRLICMTDQNRRW